MPLLNKATTAKLAFMETTRKLFSGIYSFFLGALLAFVLGFGIQAFYPQPSYPNNFNYSDRTSYQATYQSYTDSLQNYNRNVAIVIIGVSALYAAIGLLTERKIGAIADGFLLGGLFLLIYNLWRCISVSDSKMVFGALCASLFVALALGFFRFVRNPRLKAVKTV